MLCKKQASVLQQGKEICSGPVYSALFSTIGTIFQDPSMPTWQCVLCSNAVLWSPQGKSSPDHPGLCSSAVSSDTLHGTSNCHITVFSSQSLLQEVKKRKNKKKITKLIFLASPPQQSNREVSGCPGEEAAAVGACASTSWLPSPDLKLGLSPFDCRGREGGEKKRRKKKKKQQHFLRAGRRGGHERFLLCSWNKQRRHYTYAPSGCQQIEGQSSVISNAPQGGRFGRRNQQWLYC